MIDHNTDFNNKKQGTKMILRTFFLKKNISDSKQTAVLKCPRFYHIHHLVVLSLTTRIPINLADV